MSRKMIRSIIVLMSIAMIGLVGFQAYWINNAIDVNNVKFRQDVHDALNNVVSHLEKKEIYSVASKQINNRPLNQRIFQIDSNLFWANQGRRSRVKGNYSSEINQQQRNSLNWESDFIFEDSLSFGNQKIRISYHISNNGNPDYTSVVEEEHFYSQNQFEVNFRNFEDYENEVRQSIQKIAEKSHMVTVVLDDLLGEQKQISNRINKEEIDKLLKDQLNTKGINIDYEYAIVDRGMNHVIYSNYPTKDEKEVLLSDFSVKLFPNDLSSGENYLTIFFPDQTGFLIKQIWLTLTSSVFLVFLIIFSFSYAIFTIIRQKKLSDIKNDFINNMTHEFKTPISTVSLACEALQDKDIQKNESFIAKYVEAIRDENKRLGRQVEKVLQMATLDKKEYRLKFEALDIHQIIDKALSHINLQVEKRGGSIQKNLIASNSTILSDDVHLTNIIYNLLDNANKYSPDKPEIRIDTEDHHQGILIRISDKGIGMTKEAIDKIFDKFYRIPTGNLHDVKGFGLGLTYVKMILLALGGQIKVKSTPGKGSTFEIILPLNNGQN
jgi:two-component system phosphate regulon sensor histidine kinase PhoR